MPSGRKILGWIDCPVCGTKEGMRITHDKNGHPFGYCEAECSQQMRIGPDGLRIRKFLDRYPWAGGAEEKPPNQDKPGALPVAASKEDATESAKPEAKKPEPKKASSWQDLMGVSNG